RWSHRMSIPVRVVAAGLAAGCAYLAAQEVDRRIANPRSDDILLVGGLATARPRLWWPVGIFGHVFISLLFASGFVWIVGPRLSGPYWLRGLLTFQVENAVTLPAVLLTDKSHPAVQSGDVAPMTNPVYVAQATWRHLAFGTVLGWLLSPEDEYS